MCSRYNLISNLTVLGERFGFDPNQLTLESAYNVAPTQNGLTVIGGRRNPSPGLVNDDESNFTGCQNPPQLGRAAACLIHSAICSSSNSPS